MPITHHLPITFALYENGDIYDSVSNTGIDKDVAEELAKRIACHFEFSVKPRARIWHDIERGELMMTGCRQRHRFSLSRWQRC